LVQLPRWPVYTPTVKRKVLVAVWQTVVWMPFRSLELASIVEKIRGEDFILDQRDADE
jgi:hypothetical protein